CFPPPEVLSDGLTARHASTATRRAVSTRSRVHHRITTLAPAATQLAPAVAPRTTGHALAPVDDPMQLGRHAAVPLREVAVRTTRSSGPGGQHANVTESRVEASFDVVSSSSLNDEQKRRIIA